MTEQSKPSGNAGEPSAAKPAKKAAAKKTAAKAPAKKTAAKKAATPPMPAVPSAPTADFSPDADATGRHRASAAQVAGEQSATPSGPPSDAELVSLVQTPMRTPQPSRAPIIIGGVVLVLLVRRRRRRRRLRNEAAAVSD